MEEQFSEKASPNIQENFHTVSDSSTAWNRFVETGKVEDYLTYCRAEGRIGEKKE